MPGRTFSSEQYCYGYQGSERDPEMLGGAGYTTFFRALDPRIGRWLTPDPKVFPWQSPYVSMDGNPVALVDPWGASTDGGGTETRNNADGSVDEYAKNGLTGEYEWHQIVPPMAVANTPANRPFVPVSTMVFNDIVLQQQIKPGSRGKNGQGGIMFYSNFAKGSGFEGGSPDWSIDISGFDVYIGAQAGDKPSDVSNALPALTSVLSGIVQTVTDWWKGTYFGSDEGDAEPNEPAVNVVTEAQVEGVIKDFNLPPEPHRYMLGDSIQIDIVPTEGGYTDSVRLNRKTGTSDLYKRDRNNKVYLKGSKEAGDKHYENCKVVD